MHLHDPISTLPKTGPKITKALETLGIHTIKELLTYYPSRYLDFSKYTYIKDLQVGEVVTIQARVKSIRGRFSFTTRKTIVEALISDATGSLKVAWFNQGYVAKVLMVGDEILLSGKVDYYKNLLQLTNPIYEKVNETHLHTGRLVPIYKLPDGIFPKTFRTLVHECLWAAVQLEDIIPDPIRRQYHIPDLASSIRELHFPNAQESLTAAKTRLAFEESFIQQLAVGLHQQRLKTLAAPSIHTDIPYIQSVLAKLPFELTGSQKKALWQILQDMEYKHPMSLLLQGDVGSGKTILALLAALQVIRAGYQVALLVPTEVLAIQHFENLSKLIKTIAQPAPEIGLFTKNFHQIGDRKHTATTLTKHLIQGTLSLVVGTHALLQDAVSFKNMALVIVDEQHRFGVEQRKKLTAIQNSKSTKSKQQSWYPHLLSMSATPIPRTAALALYGDLNVATITELPKNRTSIRTWVVPEQKRPGAYSFIQKEVASGRQAFIITPLVEDSEKLQVKSAKAEFERLKNEVFPELQLGLIHGGLKGADKDRVMNAFKNGDIHILVATSVIEVGIDIPNASVIVIEDADRFGLAQLHQLRGRVGRGHYQSYCLLFSNAAHSQERLEFFARTTNGFTLAEYDMNTRGFGSLFGTNQTGFNFKYGQYLTLTVLHNAKKAAQELFTVDATLEDHPALRSLVLPLSAELHLE